MITILRSSLLIALASLPALAQATAPSAVGEARAVWAGPRDFVLEAAKDVPESMYAYRPTPEVRTFGQLIAHVAGSQSMFCAIALGAKPPAEDAIEKGALTKSALVAALEASNKDCAKAYAQSDKAAMQTIDLFGETHTRLYVLLNNATHDDEHYGNIVTYMRMNHMVPPSSKPRPGGM